MRGTEEERLRFLFALYDLKGDGLLDKAELVSMMHNTYKCTMMPVEEMEDAVKDTREVSPRCSVLATDMSRRYERCSTAQIKRDDIGTKEKVETSVEKIMKDLEAENGLGFEHFREFVQRHPKIMEVFVSIFKEEMWRSPRQEVQVLAASADHRRSKRRCLSCFFPARSATVHVAPTTRASTVCMPPGPSGKSGWLNMDFSEGKMYVVLRGSMLLVYLNASAEMPNSVIFLEGCFIEEKDREPDHAGFEITHMFEGFRKVTFWCQSVDDRSEWVSRLRITAKMRKVSEYYEFVELIGTGKFSEVYKGVEVATNFYWAIKVIEKKKLSEQEREMMRSEVAIMRLLNHHNVVQMKEVFEDKQKLYLVMELVEGGELFDLIKARKVLSEYTSFHVTKQLLEVVKYLHDVGIVHRDIKPENILLTDSSELPTIKLADFGLSKLIGPKDFLRNACGTLGYVAPEVLLQQPYSKPVDLWSTGIVTYLMLRGKLPFDSKDRQTLVRKAVEGALDFTGPLWDRCTHYAIDFVRKLIEKDQTARLTVDQALEHMWIRMGEDIIPKVVERRIMSSNGLDLSQTSQTGPREIVTTPEVYEGSREMQEPDDIERPATLVVQL